MIDPTIRSMPVQPVELAFATEFAPVTREQWRAALADVLRKGGRSAADPEDALSFTTYDEIVIRPLYTAADTAELPPLGVPGRPPFVRGATVAAGWDVRAHHADPDAHRTNRAVLDDLERGATSLWLVLGDGGIAVADLGAVLSGVLLDLAPIVLDAGSQTAQATQSLLALAGESGVTDALRGSLGADPVGARARTGAPVDLAELGRLAATAAPAPHLRVATVDSTVYPRAGASDAQEVGLATAVGVEYLRALVQDGLPVDAALGLLEFRFAVTAEQFPSIAKLRAARRVWHRVAELAGAAADRRGQHQHAVTSPAMFTRRDPWVNMVRTTIGCFAAAVGGAASVTVLPFDDAIGLPDDFARRIARNTQSVLHDESSLARVADAAGGSWFVESLTESLAEAAWDVFTAVERAGGAVAALDNGTILDLVAATHDRRARDIAHRTVPITGVSEFAFLDEPAVERPPAPHFQQRGPLPALRYAQDFEALRDRADAHLAASGIRPRVFLALLGPPAAHSARAAFAANLFQAGGIECLRGPVEDFAAAGTPVACLCSSDALYADQAAAAVTALRDAGAGTMWLAGRFDGAEVNGVEVDGRLFAGCDALAVLRTTLDAVSALDVLGTSDAAGGAP